MTMVSHHVHLVTDCNPPFQVPIIVIFTKYDQFLRNVGIDLEDCKDEDPSVDISQKAKEKAAKEIFEEHFMRPLGEHVPWVQFQGESGVIFLGCTDGL